MNVEATEMQNTDTVVLEAQGLEVDFAVPSSWRGNRQLRALRGVDLKLRRGEVLGVVGESGSGKSTLARALLRLLPISGGRIYWRGEEITGLDGTALQRCRRQIQIIFQDPLASLNPRLRIARALSEPLEIYEPGLSAGERAARVRRMLDSVGLDADAGERFPRQFSGGQCQRIAIARAMMLHPEVLVCDEPVSSLDVSIQGQIINLFAELREREATALLFISHNLALVRHLARRVMVMYLGRVIEQADTPDLFAAPKHPYTRALLAAMPRFDPQAPTAQHLAGEPPSSLDPPSGCAFRLLCPHAIENCANSVPALEAVVPGHQVACIRWRDISAILTPVNRASQP